MGITPAKVIETCEELCETPKDAGALFCMACMAAFGLDRAKLPVHRGVMSIKAGDDSLVLTRSHRQP